jgi:hypothetical protein
VPDLVVPDLEVAAVAAVEVVGAVALALEVGQARDSQH